MNYFYGSVLFVIIFASKFSLKAQENNTLTDADKHALEAIIVEKFHITDTANTTDLPPNTITYRIYVDMKPGYALQTIYGAPKHPLRIATTTQFFNTKIYGVSMGNQLKVADLKQDKVLIDSWLTMGAVTNSYVGLLKTDDTDGSIIPGGSFNNIDGLTAAKAPEIGVYGFELDAFNDTTNSASSFSSEDGLLAVITGIQGPTPDNRVLIAQLTTNGKLSFEFNFQLITPAKETVQYVAKDPEALEIQYAPPDF